MLQGHIFGEITDFCWSLYRYLFLSKTPIFDQKIDKYFIQGCLAHCHLCGGDTIPKVYPIPSQSSKFHFELHQDHAQLDLVVPYCLQYRVKTLWMCCWMMMSAATTIWQQHITLLTVGETLLAVVYHKRNIPYVVWWFIWNNIDLGVKIF